jgi:hypothetical protein
MKPTSLYIVLSVVTICLLSSISAFVSRPSFVVGPVTTTATTTTSSLNVFGNKKSQAQKATEEPKYWQGEWVCKDCGYIYNRVSVCASVQRVYHQWFGIEKWKTLLCGRSISMRFEIISCFFISPTHSVSFPFT